MLSQFTKKLTSLLIVVFFIISIISFGVYNGLLRENNVNSSVVTEVHDASRLGESYKTTYTTNITDYITMWGNIAYCLGISTSIGLGITIMFRLVCEAYYHDKKNGNL